MVTCTRWFSLLLIFEVINSCVYGQSKVLLKRLANCDQNKKYGVKFNYTVTTVNSQQFLDGTAIVETAVDNTIRSNVSVDMLTNGKYVYLFSINERKSCDALHKYFGEFAYELERKSQIMPGVCPIAKGRYHVHNAPLDLKKIPTLASFPFGTLRVIDHAYDRNENIYTCIVLEVEMHM